MTPLLFLAIAAAGGLGAACRLFLDGVITTAATRNALPWATIVINLTGSFLLGLVSGLAAGHLLPDPAHLILGTGFLGGYTTFSAASFETVRLLQERRWTAGLVNGLGVLAAATAAAGAGLWLGGLV
ncbi:fluoride efflux transporter CrcB [Microbacterium sp.]|uniref:fluoride efflux transporter CrcB n=1 Tax=Microbacterium sp. TaxID=51671 RepID=UPI0039E29B5C